MREASLPAGVVAVVRRGRDGLEVIIQKGLSMGTAAAAVAQMLQAEQQEEGIYRCMSGTLGGLRTDPGSRPRGG
jgi:hypothetical protein